jgi:predicted acylesterase/phospholipase RssA
MNADESEKGDKGESSGQGNPGTVRAATQPAKRRSATKRARAAAKGGNGGQKGSSERAAPEIVAALKAIQDVVTTPGAADAAIKAIKAIISASPAALGAVKDIAAGAVRAGRTRGVPKRAICLAGGGPAAGLHIGVLQGLKEHGIEFDNEDSVWALSCIGAWVGIVYNQAKEGRGLEETYNFFRDVFRDDESFRSFPTNTIFSPDWFGYADALQDFLLEPQNYRNAFVPRKIMESLVYTLSWLGDRENWRNFSEGDFNRWTLNHVLAVHPAARFLTALIFKSKINGRTKLHYPDSRFLKDIKFEKLNEPGKPYIFHNAWNLSKQELQLFSNRNPATHDYKRITPASLCACSALPLIEQTVQIDGDIYCEGALIDTVNFEELLEDHPDLDEIWISRIVDASQILPPKNMLDSTANLCELFAATVGEDDVKLFKYHVKEAVLNSTKRKWTGTIIEIQVERSINFEWSHTNLENGCARGREAAHQAYGRYETRIKDKKPNQLLIIEPTDEEKQKREKTKRERFNAIEQLLPLLRGDHGYRSLR